VPKRSTSTNDSAPPPDLPVGGESLHQRCDFERPTVEKVATEEEEQGEVPGSGEERGNDRLGVVPLVVSAGLGVNVGVGLVGRGGREGEEARRQPSWHPQLQGDSCGQAEKILMVAVA